MIAWHNTEAVVLVSKILSALNANGKLCTIAKQSMLQKPSKKSLGPDMYVKETTQQTERQIKQYLFFHPHQTGFYVHEMKKYVKFSDDSM